MYLSLINSDRIPVQVRPGIDLQAVIFDKSIDLFKDSMSRVGIVSRTMFVEIDGNEQRGIASSAHLDEVPLRLPSAAGL
jgi:hypothetical protein